MMLTAILPVRSLLLSIFILMAGNGVMTTLLGLRLESEGSSTITIGLIGTAYFGGLVIGALRATRIVRRVGHIRAFAVFVALLSASTLTYVILSGALFWMVLRLIDGICVAGIFICLESWLNERSDTRHRGSVLAAYMVALYSGQALGQVLLGSTGQTSALPFQLASILVSLAILPLCLTRSAAPAPVEAASLSIRSLLDASPLGAVGAAATGMILGAFYGLAAVQAGRLGLDLPETAQFMTIVILGGVALQWPLGRLSDLYDRRQVILIAFAGVACVSLALAAADAGDAMLLRLAGLFGGLSFALYPLCVAHCNDRLLADERIAASGRLVLLYSLGAALGPLFAATVMTILDGDGLFLFIGGCAGLTFLFGLWRQYVSDPVPSLAQRDFQVMPRTTPTAALLAPDLTDNA